MLTGVIKYSNKLPTRSTYTDIFCTTAQMMILKYSFQLTPTVFRSNLSRSDIEFFLRLSWFIRLTNGTRFPATWCSSQFKTSRHNLSPSRAICYKGHDLGSVIGKFERHSRHSSQLLGRWRRPANDGWQFRAPFRPAEFQDAISALESRLMTQQLLCVIVNTSWCS